MAAEGDEVPLSEGMPVENEDGIALGRLSALLVEEDEEQAEFFLLDAKGTERLVPFEAILGVGDGVLIVDIPAENVDRFPKLAKDAEPTDDEMQLAYDVFDSGASDSDDSDDEESSDDGL